MMKVRLNKFIAESGLCSRRKAEQYIIDFRVTINGVIVNDLSTKVDSETDEVSVDGEKIKQRNHIYFLLNKPKGVITTTDDEKKRRTVTDLIGTNEKIFPVGRLDYNTTGVLLLTNDGEFSYLLTHPKHKITKTYLATLSRPLTIEDEKKLLKGVFIENRRGRFTKIEYPNKKRKNIVEVSVVEGRNHFIKDMFNALSYNVNELERKNFGQFTADVPIGKYRKISNEEVNSVFKNYKKQL